MADDPHNPATAESESAEEVSQPEKPSTEKEPPPSKPPQPPPPAEEKEAKPEASAREVEEPSKPAEEEEKTIAGWASFKEESNVVGELPDPQKKALDELKNLLQEALNNHDFTQIPKSEEENPNPELSKEIQPEELFIYGIQLLEDERSDVILLKFLRAREFKPKDAFAMLQNTVRWRKEFGIETLLEENLEIDLEKFVFMRGFDKQDHQVCYNVYGEFQNKELYQNTLSDEEKRLKLLRWRIQFLEKSIWNLDFSPSGISTIFQVHDLKYSPGVGKREPRQLLAQALHLLQDNYPEFVAKQLFINVPWWYLAFNRMISPLLTQRSKSKFVFAGPSKSAETLFKYIAPEQVPVQYGGLSKEGDQEFTTADPVTEITIKPAATRSVEFPISGASELVWEVRVVGWNVSYGATFWPNSEDEYPLTVYKTKNISQDNETVIRQSFKIQPGPGSGSGTVVITIDNQASKRKKLLYRFKTKPSC